MPPKPQMKFSADELHGELEGAYACLSDSAEHGAMRVLLNVQWKLVQKLAADIDNQQVIFKEVHAMITSLQPFVTAVSHAVAAIQAKTAENATLKTQVTQLQKDKDSLIAQIAAGDALSNADVENAAKPLDDAVLAATTPESTTADTTPGTGATDTTGAPATQPNA
jgi:hypothetical protein